MDIPNFTFTENPFKNASLEAYYECYEQLAAMVDQMSIMSWVERTLRREFGETCLAGMQAFQQTLGQQFYFWCRNQREDMLLDNEQCESLFYLRILYSVIAALTDEFDSSSLEKEVEDGLAAKLKTLLKRTKSLAWPWLPMRRGR